MKRFKKIWVVAVPAMLMLMLCVCLTGCSKVTRDNYDRIRIGMEYRQVTELIGEPDRCDAAVGVKTCIWGNQTKNITINFVADKVVLPSMKGL